MMRIVRIKSDLSLPTGLVPIAIGARTISPVTGEVGPVIGAQTHPQTHNVIPVVQSLRALPRAMDSELVLLLSFDNFQKLFAHDFPLLLGNFSSSYAPQIIFSRSTRWTEVYLCHFTCLFFSLSIFLSLLPVSSAAALQTSSSLSYRFRTANFSSPCDSKFGYVLQLKALNKHFICKVQLSL